MNNEIKQVVTREIFIQQLRTLGVCEGMTLMVHGSLKSFGYVCGGAYTLIETLLEVIGYEGTLVVPIQSSDNSEPSYWQFPPIAIELYDVVRHHHPAFHPLLSDIQHMGIIAEGIRHREGTVLTHHPAGAFAAYGKYARFICRKHPLNFPFGDQSPLQACYDLKAYVLLLGVDYSKSTGFHLAEMKSEMCSIGLQGGAVEINGERKWQKYLDIHTSTDDFNEVGQYLQKKQLVSSVTIDQGCLRLFPYQPAVDLAVLWFKENR